MASPFKKLVAVGDADCGKTALFQVYLKNKYLDEETPITVGNEIVNINVDGKTVEVSLWCTSGQEEYDALRTLPYYNADVVLMCFSIDSPASMENIEKIWMPEVQRHCPKAPIVLVGNKIDFRMDVAAKLHLAKSNLELIKTENGHAMAKKIHAREYVECSAKLNEGVREVFQAAARALLRIKKRKSKLFVVQ